MNSDAGCIFMSHKLKKHTKFSIIASSLN